MGQTLTHGVYLPDEGERNCYSGLAGNWQLLDNSVGTIAEHTTALAGKAPAVHTHTKADITDLFNSANTWTGDNTYSKTVAIERSTDTGTFLALKNTVAELGSTPASATPATIGYSDKNNDNLGYMGMFYDTDGSNRFRLFVRNKYASGSPSTSGTTDYTTFQLRLNADQSKEGILRASFRPYDNNTYDLGSSSYQWNNLYAKNYYYNGTAWGLDKANEWSADQTTTGSLFIKSTTLQKGVIPSSNTHKNLYFSDKNGANIGVIRLRLSTGGGASFRMYGSTLIKDGHIDPEGTEFNWGFGQYLNPDGTAYFSFDGNIANNLIPTSSNYTLGTSTNKWKTLNGINPGALSLPDYNNVLDVTSEVPIASLDGNTQINLDDYLSNKTGWLSIVIDDTAGNSILVTQGKTGGATAFNNSRSFHTGAQSGGYISVFMPLISGMSKKAFIKASSLIQMRFYYCLGNV